MVHGISIHALINYRASHFPENPQDRVTKWGEEYTQKFFADAKRRFEDKLKTPFDFPRLVRRHPQGYLWIPYVNNYHYDYYDPYALSDIACINYWQQDFRQSILRKREERAARPRWQFKQVEGVFIFPRTQWGDTIFVCTDLGCFDPTGKSVQGGDWWEKRAHSLSGKKVHKFWLSSSDGGQTWEWDQRRGKKYSQDTKYAELNYYPSKKES